MSVKISTLVLQICLWTLCITCADSVDRHEDVFQISPRDFKVYFDTPKRLQRICAPPSGSEFAIVWWKNRKRLVNNMDPRISIETTTDESAINSLGLEPGSTVSILSIKALIKQDEGDYSCSITNNTNHYSAEFKVHISDNCKEGSFKCVDDRKCILSYSLCDGIGHCKNNIDESTQAGCALPKPPQNVEVEADSPTDILIQWQPVKLAKYYQIELKYPAGQVDLIKRRSAFTLTSIGNLKPATKYSLHIQTVTLTGYSEFTDYVTVKTKSSASPTAPVIHESHIVTTFSDIFLSWDPVPDADTYQAVIYYPDGKFLSEYKDHNIRTVRFKDLEDDTKYEVKIRARSDIGFGDYSSVTVETKKLKPPGRPKRISQTLHVEDMGVTISWKQPKRLGNSFKPDISYSIEYCIYVPYEATETIVQNVTENNSLLNQNDGSKLANGGNEKNKRELFQRKNGKSIDEMSNESLTNGLRKVQKKFNVTVTKYKTKDCKYARTSQTSITLNRLQASLYWYRVTTIGARNIVGRSVEGNFTIKMYISTTTATTELDTMTSSREEFSGIVIFAIVTASLCVILIIAFLFAWACKWQILMDAVAEYRVGVYDTKHLNISGNNHANNHHHNKDELYKKLQS